MDGPFARPLAFCLLGGIVGLFIGTYQCVKGHIYFVAAQHEATAAGRVVGMYHGKGGSAYHYVFSVNGVEMDDQSEVCATPLARRACDNNGPVLVYYSFQPFSNSLLEDFFVASSRAYRTGKFALAMGLPFLIFSSMGIAVQVRQDKREGDSDPEVERDTPSAVPDDLHVVPHE